MRKHIPAILAVAAFLSGCGEIVAVTDAGLDGAPLDGAPLDGAPLDGAPLDGAPLDTLAQAAEIRFSPTHLFLPEEQSVTITVWLTTQPVTDVSVKVIPEDPNVVTASPDEVVFTPAEQVLSREVVVFAPHDSDNNPGTTKIQATSPEAEPASLVVEVTDNDP